MYCACLDTIPESDGQTDGQRDGFAITISRSACINMLTRDKNCSVIRDIEQRSSDKYRPSSPI